MWEEEKRKRKGTTGIVYVEFLTVGGSTLNQLSSESAWRKYSQFLYEEIPLCVCISSRITTISYFL